MGKKIGSVLSVPVGLALVVLFFFPWLNLTCKGGMGPEEKDKERKVGQASGLQLAIGTLTPYKDDKPFEPEGEKEQKQVDEMNETIQARPWFFVALIAPLLLILIGVVGVLGKAGSGPVGVVMILLGILGVVMMVMAMLVDYQEDMIAKGRQDEREKLVEKGTAEAEITKILDEKEKKQREQIEEGKKKGQGYYTRARGALWISLVLYVVTIGLGALVMFVSKPAAAAAPAPAPEPQAQAPPAQQPAPAAPEQPAPEAPAPPQGPDEGQQNP